MNKRILIQQRALACLRKSVVHILQRELYTMGNTGLLRRKAEMTFLDYTSVQVTVIQDGEDFLLKKAQPKVLDPIKTSPFVVPTTIRKEAPTGNAPMGAIPPKAVINRFSQVGGNRTTEASGVVFNPIQ